MVFIEFLILKYKKQLKNLVTKRRTFSYIIASFFGILPGCTGTFLMDSLYMTGLAGFGALIATMIATSGDEAFVMFSMVLSGKIPFWPIALLMFTLFVLGIIGAFLADFLKKRYHWKVHKKHLIKYHKNEEFHFKHFLKVHVYKHIIRKHIWQISLWLFAALFLIGLANQYIVSEHLLTGVSLFVMLLVATLIGLLPISGPNVFLIVLFSQGIIPFSILLANSIVQDGHGLLPIIGFSLNDAWKIKLFNFVFGLGIGLFLFLFGL